MKYQTYLKSAHWRNLRGAKLQQTPRCEHCGTKKELEVHHIFYRPDLHDAILSDLQTLCHDCHLAVHSKGWKKRRQPLGYVARETRWEQLQQEARIETARQVALRATTAPQKPIVARPSRHRRRMAMLHQRQALEREPIPTSFSAEPI